MTNPARTYSTLVISRTSKKPGFWIGDTLVQVTQDGGKIRVAITAPKTATILRGELVEDDDAYRGLALAPYSIEQKRLDVWTAIERNIPSGPDAPFKTEALVASAIRYDLDAWQNYRVVDARGDVVYTPSKPED